MLPIITPLKVCGALSTSADCGGCMLLFLDTTRKSNSSDIFILCTLFPAERADNDQPVLAALHVAERMGLWPNGKKSNEQSVEEMNRADMLIVWIILLEGQSNLYSPDPLRISQTPKGTLERDLAVEQATQRCPPILPRRWGFRHQGAV